MAELPSGTVTLLFTDIEGSTRLLQELGRDRYVRALTEHRRLLRDAFGRNGGVEVEMQGDSFHFAFACARSAVLAAAEAQKALATHSWESEPIRVRIGLHTGEPLPVDGLYAGLDVHRAARVMAAGHGGQVLVSQTTRDLVEQEFELRDLGEHRLKDLTAPQRLYQLGRGDFPPLKTLQRTNLPIPATRFLGRERELADIAALLQREHVRLLTLTGPGGTGKTRIAVQLAADMIGDFPDGVFFVSLAPISDPELVLPMVALALGVRELPAQTFASTLADYLSEKRLLLLLDNFEQVAGAAPYLASLLSAVPSMKALVTSRMPLHLSGECEYPVPVLADEEAVALFAERAAAAKPTFVINGNRSSIAEICRRVDNLPLAIELAAARVKLLPPQALLRRLDQRLKLLTSGPADLPARQQTLQATIDWSHSLLSEDERGLFACLAVFVGGWTLEAAEAVCDRGVDVVEGLASLLDKSLLQQKEINGEPRLSMLETIRAYALEQLEQAEQETECRRQHLRYYTSLARQAEPELRGPRQLEWFDVVEAEHDNLRAALGFALIEDEAEIALRLCRSLTEFWDVRGHHSEARGWLEQALEHQVPDDVRGQGLGALALFAARQGDLEEARALTGEAAELLAQHDNHALARALSVAGFIDMIRGELESSLQLNSCAVEIAQRSGDQWLLAWTLNSYACAIFESGDRARSDAMLEEAAQIFRSLGDRRMLTAPLGNLAEQSHASGDVAAAAKYIEEALSSARELGDRGYLVGNLTQLGHARLASGELEEARSALSEALALGLELGSKTALLEALYGLAAAAGAEGDDARAVELWATVETHLGESHGKLGPLMRWTKEGFLEPLRNRVDASAFEQAWRTGTATSMREAAHRMLVDDG
jgi:predicted ATPase/class 3 adenylate cyclase